MPGYVLAFDDEGPPTEVDGVLMPSRFRAAWRYDGIDVPDTAVTVELVDGVWRAVDLRLSAGQDSPAVTAELVVKVARTLDGLVTAAVQTRARNAVLFDQTTETAVTVLSDDKAERFARATAARQRRRWVTRELLVEVA